MKEQVVCIYHKNCTDGTTAAAVLLTKHPDCLLFPLDHNYSQEDLEQILKVIDKNTTVYIVDFSLKNDDTEKIIERAKEVINIDHHIGVKDKLEKYTQKYPNFKFIFDNNRSGASLTWIYFYGDENIPDVIKYVEDKDIWTWKYGEITKYVNAYLAIFTNKPEEIKKYIENPEKINELINNGKIIAEYTDYLIQNFVSRAKEVTLKIGKFNVKGYNTGLFQSEIGNILSTEYKETVALFNINGDYAKISFRSVEGAKPTALDLATILGGGGHKHAAGASVDLETFCKKMVIIN